MKLNKVYRNTVHILMRGSEPNRVVGILAPDTHDSPETASQILPAPSE